MVTGSEPAASGSWPRAAVMKGLTVLRPLRSDIFAHHHLVLDQVNPPFPLISPPRHTQLPAVQWPQLPCFDMIWPDMSVRPKRDEAGREWAAAHLQSRQAFRPWQRRG